MNIKEFCQRVLRAQPLPPTASPPPPSVRGAVDASLTEGGGAQRRREWGLHHGAKRRKSYSLLSSVLCLLLPACSSLLNAPKVIPERFDLGLGSVETAQTATPVRPIPFELRAAPALDNSAMRYRLNYADPAKVMEYSRSRWAGTSGEILEQYLKIHLNQSDVRPQSAKRCRFDLELLRFEQVFTSVEVSHGLIIVHARLQSPGAGVLDESNHELTVPTPTPDASGGVKALAQAAEQLARELSQRFASQSCQN